MHNHTFYKHIIVTIIPILNGLRFITLKTLIDGQVRFVDRADYTNIQYGWGRTTGAHARAKHDRATSPLKYYYNTVNAIIDIIQYKFNPTLTTLNDHYYFYYYDVIWFLFFHFTFFNNVFMLFKIIFRLFPEGLKYICNNLNIIFN